MCAYWIAKMKRILGYSGTGGNLWLLKATFSLLGDFLKFRLAWLVDDGELNLSDANNSSSDGLTGLDGSNTAWGASEDDIANFQSHNG